MLCRAVLRAVSRVAQAVAVVAGTALVGLHCADCSAGVAGSVHLWQHAYAALPGITQYFFEVFLGIEAACAGHQSLGLPKLAVLFYRQGVM